MMKIVSAGTFVASMFVAQAAFAAGFSLTSPEVHKNGNIGAEQVYNGFGCTGKNISPALAWSGAPAGTKSFAITVYDPDAPTGSGWWHWVVFNLPGTATGVARNAGSPETNLLPAGSIQSRTDYGKPGYGGPCPPVGDKAHRYVFTVHALKIDKLPLDENTSAAMVGFYLHQNALATAELRAQYGR
jgi:Raf kinase inhibitor-like YbhB/YbcL family protein